MEYGDTFKFLMGTFSCLVDQGRLIYFMLGHEMYLLISF